LSYLDLNGHKAITIAVVKLALNFAIQARNGSCIPVLKPQSELTFLDTLLKLAQGESKLYV